MQLLAGSGMGARQRERTRTLIAYLPDYTPSPTLITPGRRQLVRDVAKDSDKFPSFLITLMVGVMWILVRHPGRLLQGKANPPPLPPGSRGCKPAGICPIVPVTVLFPHWGSMSVPDHHAWHCLPANADQLRGRPRHGCNWFTLWKSAGVYLRLPPPSGRGEGDGTTTKPGVTTSPFLLKAGRMSPTGNDRTPQDRFFPWSFELPHSGLLPPPLIVTTHLLPIIAAATAATRLLELERVRFPRTITEEGRSRPPLCP